MSELVVLDQYILELLADGKKRLVELQQQLANHSKRTIRYRLERLAKDGLIETSQSVEAPVMTFRYWRITSKGARALAKLTTQTH